MKVAGVLPKMKIILKKIKVIMNGKKNLIKMFLVRLMGLLIKNLK